MPGRKHDRGGFRSRAFERAPGDDERGLGERGRVEVAVGGDRIAHAGSPAVDEEYRLLPVLTDRERQVASLGENRPRIPLDAQQHRPLCELARGADDVGGRRRARRARERVAQRRVLRETGHRVGCHGIAVGRDGDADGRDEFGVDVRDRIRASAGASASGSASGTASGGVSSGRLFLPREKKATHPP